MKTRSFLFVLLVSFKFVFAQNGAFKTFEHECKDKVKRPFIVYTPQKVKNQEHPLLVYLHGSISSPNIKKNPLEYMQKSKLIKIAEDNGFSLLFSYGQKGATWFDTVGTEMVLDEIKKVKNQFNIDKNKVFLSGFSDGGTGVYYFAMNHPENFAGFISMNGSIKVADKLGKHPIYPENMNNVPMLIINTKKDALYPISQMKSSVEYLMKFNPHINFQALEGNHEMSYLEKNPKIIGNFIQQNSLKKKNRIALESNENFKGIHWLSIKKIDTTQIRKTFHHQYKHLIFNDKAYIGLQYDYAYKGKGLKVKGFNKKHHTAKKMGIKIGDIILKMDNTEMSSFYSPYTFKAKKKAGDHLNITVLRNGKEQILDGKIDDGYEYNLFSHPKHSGKILAEIKGKKILINTSKVSTFEIDFSQIHQKIKRVIVNGKKHKIKRKQRNQKVVFTIP